MKKVKTINKMVIALDPKLEEYSVFIISEWSYGCFWQVKNQAVRSLIFQAPHIHYWDFMVE